MYTFSLVGDFHLTLQVVPSWPNSLAWGAEHLPEAQLAIHSSLRLTDFLGELACRVGEDGVHKPNKIAFDSHEAVN